MRQAKRRAKTMRKAAKRRKSVASRGTKSTKRRTSKKSTKKKGKRKLSNWNKQVAAAFKSLKKTNPNATLGDAMKKASKDKKALKGNRPLSMSVDGGGPVKGPIKRSTRAKKETPQERKKRQEAEATALGSDAVQKLKETADSGGFGGIDLNWDDGK